MFSLTIKRPLTSQQIDVWVAWHTHDSLYGGMYLLEYEMWVRRFVKFIRKHDIRDIGDNDIDSFLRHVRATTHGEMHARKATKAINSIMKFYQARGKQMERLYNS